MEIKWNYLQEFGEEAFASEALKAAEVILLDSSLFQFQIFTFLLKNTPYERMEEFIQKFFHILEPLKPALIYFYREKTEEAISYLEKQRGIGFLEYLYERDKGEPFYENRPSGVEGTRQLLRHYGCWVNKLYEAAGCRKMALELSKEQWKLYEEELLSFLRLKRLENYKAQCCCDGTYRNEEMNTEIKIEEGDLIDGWGNRRKLLPKSHCELYI